MSGVGGLINQKNSSPFAAMLDDDAEAEREALGEGELFETRRRRDTLHHLPTQLLSMVDGGKLSRQGRIDKLLASKTPGEVRRVRSLSQAPPCPVRRAEACQLPASTHRWQSDCLLRRSQRAAAWGLVVGRCATLTNGLFSRTVLTGSVQLAVVASDGGVVARCAPVWHRCCSKLMGCVCESGVRGVRHRRLRVP